jgi:ankyrin repeat protein
MYPASGHGDMDDLDQPQGNRERIIHSVSLSVAANNVKEEADTEDEAGISASRSAASNTPSASNDAVNETPLNDRTESQNGSETVPLIVTNNFPTIKDADKFEQDPKSPMAISDSEENRSLVSAALTGDVEKVKDLIAHGAVPGYQNEVGNTALHEACTIGNIEIVWELLNCEGAVHALHLRGFQGYTPLRCAIESTSANALPIVEAILPGSGEALLDKAKDGTSALEAACTSEKILLALEILDSVYGRRATLTISRKAAPIHTACGRGLFPIVEKMLDILSDPALMEKKDVYGFTSMHIAAENGNFDIVKLLLERGVPLSVRDAYDQTPLHRKSTLPLMCIYSD